MRRVLIQEADFDTGAELAARARNAGAVASFIGIVRGESQGKTLAALWLEHYPGMTERVLDHLADAALARWPLGGLTLIHRVGRLSVGANIVLVAASSAHRSASLAATAYLIDQLKIAAPFWKAEEFADGSRQWVAARAADADAAAAWSKTLPDKT